MNNLGIALEMLIVGMITVFIILSLVVLIGNLIIRFANKYLPEEIKNKVLPGAVTGNSKIAAIVSAVNIATRGKGRVEKIEKHD